jgi:thioredoxin 2
MQDPMIRTCAACATQNRVPAWRLAGTGRCGACKAPLPPAGEPLDVVDTASFDEIIRQARVPVFVDFWAEWCGPCRMTAPEVHALAREMAGKALVLKVDIEAHPGLAARYRVQGVPAFIVFRKRGIVFQRSGAAPRKEMRRWLAFEDAAAA